MLPPQKTGSHGALSWQPEQRKTQRFRRWSGACSEKKNSPLLPGSACFLGGAVHTLGIMRQAPVLIFIVNPMGRALHAALTLEERVFELCNAQSVGAAVENMALAATELGLGSLWICDTYFAYPELCEWLGSDGELLAAMAVGYAQEAPPARPRKSMADAVEWRG